MSISVFYFNSRLINSYRRRRKIFAIFTRNTRISLNFGSKNAVLAVAH